MLIDAALLPHRYRGARLIARGGMGEIYRATDDVLGRAVAIKMLAERYAEDESVRTRFTREALAAARLSGEPNIVTIYDVGEHGERPYLVMEYLGGGSLADRLRGGRPATTGQALGWLEQAARALDAAHRHGVVHRDVKPGNLLLDRSGNINVADFGVASAAGLDSVTSAGTVLGTAGYMSPEQAMGERAGPASDVYALAVVAFELLTGSRPYESDSVAAEATAHVHSPIPSAWSRRPELPRELDAVFRRGLAKDPAERQRSCAEFVAELRDALERSAGDTMVARAHPQAHRAAPFVPVRRSRALPLAASAVAVAAIGGAAAAVVVTRGHSRQAAAVPTTITVATTVARTVATTVAPTSTPSATTSTAAPVSGGGHNLNDRGYALMRGGDYAAALPLLQAAAAKLSGAGPSDPYEGYANYNLGYTLARLGRCGEALRYLQAADRLEPGNADVHRALARARRCP